MPSCTDPVKLAVARHARACQPGRDPAERVATKAALTEAKLEKHIREVVDGFPPLTDAQRDRLAALLTGAR